MKELTVDQLKTYIKTAIDLEGQILIGQRAIESIEQKKRFALSDHKRKAPTLKTVERPQKKEFVDFYGEEIDGVAYVERPKVVSTDMSIASIIGTSFVLFLSFSVIGCLLVALLGVMQNFDILQACKWPIIISAILSVLLVIVLIHENNKSSRLLDEWRQANKEYDKKYEKEKEKRLKAIEKDYRREMDSYSRLVKDSEEKYNKATATAPVIVQSIEDAAASEIKKIDDAIWSTKAALRKVYEKDVIYPKYRNLIALCSLYEYLDSGRCNCLEGHEGAYNLYEAELRQDLILIKLDVIITQLEDIKKNQFKLYEKMCEIKSAVSSISYQMGELLKKADTLIDNTNKIASTTAKIEENTRVTALCSQMVAKNTEAIKCISLIN